MKNSHQCIDHLIFKGQEDTVPYVIVKRNTKLYYYIEGYINIHFAMLDYKLHSE